MCMYKFIFDRSVACRGVMTKRVDRMGGLAPAEPGTDTATKAASAGPVGTGLAAAARLFTPASSMPLLRGITPASIN